MYIRRGQQKSISEREAIVTHLYKQHQLKLKEFLSLGHLRPLSDSSYQTTIDLGWSTKMPAAPHESLRWVISMFQFELTNITRLQVSQTLSPRISLTRYKADYTVNVSFMGRRILITPAVIGDIDRHALYIKFHVWSGPHVRVKRAWVVDNSNFASRLLVWFSDGLSRLRLFFSRALVGEGRECMKKAANARDFDTLIKFLLTYWTVWESGYSASSLSELTRFFYDLCFSFQQP